MKIDRSNPFHWIYLAIFTANTCIALLLRCIIPKSHSHTTILYGHKLNGNLKAIYDYSYNDAQNTAHDFDLFFLTFDPAYYKRLKQENCHVLSGLNPFHMMKLASTNVIISDHGLHSLILFLKYSNIKFVDVWHGIPFKGFDPDDFQVQHRYEEVWVTSDKLRQLYVQQFGFSQHLVKVTGYARTDVLIHQQSDTKVVRHKLGIMDNAKKIILFAPTWQQDQQNRNIFPFDMQENNFLNAMNNFCEQQNAICLLRQHLNTAISGNNTYQHICYASSQIFPDTEEILLVSDILICDWSSIAFDYLLLQRPTLFLDVEPPFKKGFSLDAGYRFGEIITRMEALFEYLELYLSHPDTYEKKYSKQYEAIKEVLYADTADGHSAERCFKRLLHLQHH